MKSLEFLPAVDIKSGQVNQGIESVSNQYQGSPQEVISEFISAGCTWVHLVDLDLAYSSGNNFDLISGLINSTKVNTNYQVGYQIKKISIFH